MLDGGQLHKGFGSQKEHLEEGVSDEEGIRSGLGVDSSGVEAKCWKLEREATCSSVRRLTCS